MNPHPHPHNPSILIDEHEGELPMFEVQLDIFSGRPNPRWTLNPVEEAELIQRLLDRSVPIAPMTITDGKL